MGRYTGPKTKVSRRFGEPIFGPDKVLERRNFPPGMHVQKRKRKLSEYGEQLREKQKAKAIYGMLERQFHLFYTRALSKQGKTGEILLQMCESRLDNIVYRLGIAPSRAAARQLITHRHIIVDGEMLSIPSYTVKPGQTVGVREKSRTLVAVVNSLAQPRTALSSWLEWNNASMTGTYTRQPDRAEIPENIDEQSIVELYSR